VEVDLSAAAGEYGLRLVAAPAATPASAAYGARVEARVQRLAAGQAAAAPPGAGATQPGAVVEFSPACVGLAAELGSRLAADGGAALVIDYGHAEGECTAATGLPSLRGIRGHGFVDVLHAPGETDLSADVDFAALAEGVAEGAAGSGAGGPGGAGSGSTHAVAVHGPITQSRFLQAMGLAARLQRLLEGGGSRGTPDEATRGRLVGEAMRLAGTEAGQMGSVYKAMAVVAAPRGAEVPPPPAFD
jgi:NADH dehydrogenase [ubiquinone] 1 alpha subcomplex assembly factor 7